MMRWRAWSVVLLVGCSSANEVDVAIQHLCTEAGASPTCIADHRAAYDAGTRYLSGETDAPMRRRSEQELHYMQEQFQQQCRAFFDVAAPSFEPTKGVNCLSTIRGKHGVPAIARSLF